MPDTPDTLPDLLAAWAERYPNECCPRGQSGDGFILCDAVHGIVCDVWLSPHGDFDLYMRYAVEGHARACIERAGWMWDFARLPRHVLFAAWPDKHGHSRGGAEMSGEATALLAPHLDAAALVRLRLALPTPDALTS